MDNAVKEIDLDNWITVKTAGGGFLGCLSGAAISRLAGTSREDRITTFKKKVFNILKDNDGWLELCPVFDLAVPIRPVPHPSSRGASSTRRTPSSRRWTSPRRRSRCR